MECLEKVHGRLIEALMGLVVQGVSSILTRSTYELKRDYRAECLCFFSLGFSEEVMVLEAHPVFRFVSEIASELQAVLRCEKAAACENVIEQLRADVEVGGELRLGQAVIVQEIPQHGGGGVC